MAVYMVMISIDNGKSYWPKVGWDTEYTDLREAKAARNRASMQDGWMAKVVKLRDE